MTNALITDGKKLSTYITATLKGYQSAGTRVHISVVSAFVFAALTGQNAMLNQVYEGLRSNDQQAMKLFIRRASAINGMVLSVEPGKKRDDLFKTARPDGHDAEMIVQMVAAGAVVDLVKGQFVVTKGHNTVEAKAMVNLLTNRLLNPDGELDKPVLDRNNFAEVKVLGDAQALDQLLKVLRSLDSDSDTKRITVSDQVRKLFTDMKVKAEAFAKQTSLDAA